MAQPEADTGHEPSRLAQYLALLYGLMIVYASLEPFSGWMMPLPDTPFFLFAPQRFTRFDIAINVIAYAPFGFFLALIGRKPPSSRLAMAVGAAALLAFAMETGQMFLPTRDASWIDIVSNASGAALGAGAALGLDRMPGLRRGIQRW